MARSKIIIIEPGKPPVISWEYLTLSWMQKTVGGYIEAIYPFDDNAALVCNDEGKLDGSKPNRALRLNGKVYDVVYGTFIIVGTGGEDFIGLTNAQAMRYSQMFKSPEYFVTINGKLTVLQEPPGKQAFMGL